MSEHFDRYMEGWTKGDVEMLLSACAEDFVFDDAIDGRFTKAELPAYFESLAEGVLKITDVVTEEIGGLETAWCWWSLEAPAGCRRGVAGRRRPGQGGTRRRALAEGDLLRTRAEYRAKVTRTETSPGASDQGQCKASGSVLTEAKFDFRPSTAGLGSLPASCLSTERDMVEDLHEVAEKLRLVD